MINNYIVTQEVRIVWVTPSRHRKKEEERELQEDFVKKICWAATSLL